MANQDDEKNVGTQLVDAELADLRNLMAEAAGAAARDPTGTMRYLMEQNLQVVRDWEAKRAAHIARLATAPTDAARRSFEAQFEEDNSGARSAMQRATTELRQVIGQSGGSKRSDAQERQADASAKHTAAQTEALTQINQQRQQVRGTDPNTGQPITGWTNEDWAQQQARSASNWIAQRRQEYEQIVHEDSSKAEWAKFEYKKDRDKVDDLWRDAESERKIAEEMRKNEMARWQTETQLESQRYSTDSRNVEAGQKSAVDQRGQDMNSLMAQANLMGELAGKALPFMIGQGQNDQMNQYFKGIGVPQHPFTPFGQVAGFTPQDPSQFLAQRLGPTNLPPQVAPPQWPTMNQPQPPMMGRGGGTGGMGFPMQMPQMPDLNLGDQDQDGIPDDEEMG